LSVIQAVERKLQEASNKLSTVGTRSRAIERKLREVQELPAAEAQALLPEAAPEVADEAEEIPADSAEPVAHAPAESSPGLRYTQPEN